MNSERSFSIRRTSKPKWNTRERKREEWRFTEVDEWGCTRWRNNAEIEFDLDLVPEEDDACIELDFKLYERTNISEEDVNLIFDKFLVSHFTKSSTEDLESKLEDITEKMLKNVIRILFQIKEIRGKWWFSDFFAEHRWLVYHNMWCQPIFAVWEILIF